MRIVFQNYRTGQQSVTVPKYLSPAVQQIDHVGCPVIVRSNDDRLTEVRSKSAPITVPDEKSACNFEQLRTINNTWSWKVARKG